MSARIRRLSPSARTCVFVKQSPGPVCCNPSRPRRASLLYHKGHPFSRSYGVSLPSSLTRDLPTALGLLPPPTCVGLRYGQPTAPPGLFSTPQAQSDHLWVAPPALDHLSEQNGLPPAPTGFDVVSNPTPDLPPSSPGFLPTLSRGSCTVGRYRNINLLSIAYGYYPLGLGPTNPTRIHLPSETLGLRRTRFARAFSLLIPAFSLRLAPGHLTASPSSRSNAPLPKKQARTRLLPRLRWWA